MEWVQVRSQGFPKDGWGVLKSLWRSPDKLLFGAQDWIFPFKGEDGLWHWGEAYAEQVILEMWASVNFSPQQEVAK